MTGKPPSDTLLRLYLPADWPTQQTACDWELVSTSGARLQRGHSEPRHWPTAARCEIILSAEQCLPLSANLPKGARTRMAEVIGYALEERLLGDIDSEHFTIGDETRDGQTPVWVISRARLHSLLAALRPFNRSPQRLLSELQLIPVNPGWSVCLKPQGGFVRTAAEAGFSFDLPGGDAAELPLEPPLELQLASTAAQQPPTRIDVYTATGVTFNATQASAWQTRLGIPVQHAGEYLWREAPSQTARNLLTGDFTPPRARGEGWSSLKPTAWLAAFGLTLYSVFSFAEWAHLEHQKTQMRQQMTERFRATFPQAQTIVDPALQMQRLHDQLRRERGQLGAGDFLPLLAAATETAALPGTLRHLDFEDGRLDMTLRLADASAVERLRDTLTRRGLGVTVRAPSPTSSPSTGSVEALFAVRGAP
ncbi:MAG: hypothetical protein KBD60_08740 [Sterolibacterium sp.]|jgi:type II secretion system protein L|nr:hypothetical protein [Sterolibacterium sp.]